MLTGIISKLTKRFSTIKCDEADYLRHSIFLKELNKNNPNLV